MLSRKYYEMIAGILRTYHTREDIMDSFIKEFILDNPRFDVKRFREACGM